MPAYTLEELRTELAAVRAEMAKICGSGQAYTAGGPGQDMVMSRARYDSLHQREKWLVGEIERLEILAYGPARNLAKFRRER